MSKPAAKPRRLASAPRPPWRMAASQALRGRGRRPLPALPNEVAFEVDAANLIAVCRELRDNAEGLQQVQRRLQKSPLGSAAGYGSPNLPIDRADTSRRLGFAIVQEHVTSVQLSRGKAEAQLLFEIALVMQDVARLSSDLLLFYTQEFSFVELPDAFTTGSSIMPQKRNPDVFELIRGRSATAQACLLEVMGIVAKLPSGYQRDLQLIKVPLFRSIDVCAETLAILPIALAGVKFRREKIRLDPSIHAAAEANELVVKEGIPFREAYRRVGEKLKGK